MRSEKDMRKEAADFLFLSRKHRKQTGSCGSAAAVSRLCRFILAHVCGLSSMEGVNGSSRVDRNSDKGNIIERDGNLPL